MSNAPGASSSFRASRTSTVTGSPQHSSRVASTIAGEKSLAVTA